MNHFCSITYAQDELSCRHESRNAISAMHRTHLARVRKVHTSSSSALYICFYAFAMPCMNVEFMLKINKITLAKGTRHMGESEKNAMKMVK